MNDGSQGPQMLPSIQLVPHPHQKFFGKNGHRSGERCHKSLAPFKKYCNRYIFFLKRICAVFRGGKKKGLSFSITQPPPPPPKKTNLTWVWVFFLKKYDSTHSCYFSKLALLCKLWATVSLSVGCPRSTPMQPEPVIYCMPGCFFNGTGPTCQGSRGCGTRHHGSRSCQMKIGFRYSE